MLTSWLRGVGLLGDVRGEGFLVASILRVNGSWVSVACLKMIQRVCPRPEHYKNIIIDSH